MPAHATITLALMADDREKDMSDLETRLAYVKRLPTILSRLLSTHNLDAYRLCSSKRNQHSFLHMRHRILGVSGILGALVAVTLCSTAMNTKSYADSSTKYRVALAMYAFQNLRAMPIMNNRSIAVGDVVGIETESVLRSAKVCYPSLSEMEIFSGQDKIKVSHDAALQVAGIAGTRQYSIFAVDLQQHLSGRSVLLIDNLKGYAPDPDQYELERHKVSSSEPCQRVHTVYDGSSARNILVSTVYRAVVSGQFHFSNSEIRDVNFSINPWRFLLDQPNVEIRSEDDLTMIHVTGRSWGSIAVQALRLDLEKLAQLYALFGENPETVAEYERQVHRYLTAENPGILEEIRLGFLDFLERFGFPIESIEDLRNQLVEQGTVVTAEEIEEVPQEWWDAVGVVGAGVEIIGSDVEPPE